MTIMEEEEDSDVDNDIAIEDCQLWQLAEKLYMYCTTVEVTL